jgi:hypothetical protein
LWAVYLANFFAETLIPYVVAALQPSNLQ